MEAAFHAYKNNTVQLVDRDLTGMTHLVATRHGIFAASPTGFRLLAHGFFFGLTVRDDCFFAFEACDQPRGPTRQGRIVCFQTRHGAITQTRITARGLDNGCHAIDFIHGRLCVTDTYNQRILRFHPGEQTYDTLSPLPTRPGRWPPGDPAYHHLNSILAVGQHIILLLHNNVRHTGRHSELAILNRDWQELARLPLAGTGCHSLALLPGGTLLTCGSMEGTLLTPQGLIVPVTDLMTRGLAVGPDSIAVGASQWSRREDRLTVEGTLTFLDRDYALQSVLHLPGAPMEVRRLDGQDASQSGWLAAQPWAQSLHPDYLTRMPPAPAAELPC